MPAQFQRVVLASRPLQRPSEANFRLETVAMPQLTEGKVLVQSRTLSVDPYMLGRMSASRSYATPQALDEVMMGEVAGTIAASRHPGWQVGQAVVGPLGWQEYAVSDGSNLTPIHDTDLPLSVYLGAVGMTGITAWYGIRHICAPRPGQTVVVSGAAGAVGSVALQLARQSGCRVVGIAGGADKCAHVVAALGADACVDYKGAADASALQQLIKEAAPDGVDAFFDNVNGMVLDALLPLMNPFGRIALCGMIARYGERSMHLAQHGYLLLSRLRAEGFIVYDQNAHWPAAQAELGALVRSGALRVHETVSVGLASAPAACIGLMEGRNIGKQLVQLDCAT